MKGSPALLLLGVTLAAAVSGACASSGARPAPFPRPASSAAPVSPAAYDAGIVVRTALGLRGVPYRDGGADPSGFDCSGLVAYVLAQSGIEVPRTVAGQYALGRRVPSRAIEPGDLVFFRTVTRGASHVGIAISATEFVHAPSSAGVVRVEELRARYWASRLLGARRLY